MSSSNTSRFLVMLAAVMAVTVTMVTACQSSKPKRTSTRTTITPAQRDPVTQGQPAPPADVVAAAPEQAVFEPDAMLKRGPAGGTRVKLFERLRRISSRPVSITRERESGAVLLLVLDAPAGKAGTSAIERASAFLKEYMPLIDPAIPFGELVVQPDLVPCSESAVMFARVIGKTRVLDSIITVQFSREGRVTNVLNSLASVPSKLVDASRAALPELRDELARERHPELAKLGPKDCRRERVLVAAADRSGLLSSELLVWDSGRGRLRGAVLTGEAVVVPPFDLDPAPLDADGGRVLVHVDERTGMPDSLSFHGIGGLRIDRAPGQTNPAELALRFLEQHPGIFRTGAPRCQVEVTRIASNPQKLPGVEFVRLRQRFAGLPVFGAELVVEIHDQERIFSVSGHTLPEINLDVIPQISAQDAVETTRNRLGRSGLASIGVGEREELMSREFDRTRFVRELRPDVIARLTNPNSTLAPAQLEALKNAAGRSELVIFPGTIVPRRSLSNVLAWHVTIDEFNAFIDARSGEFIYSFSTRSSDDITDGRGLDEFGRLSYTLVMRNGNPTGALPPNADVATCNTAVNAVRSFYDSLGWRGLDGRSANFNSNTNVTISSGCPNAFFDAFLTNEAFFCTGMATDDVVAHEFTHGVIAHSSNLIYQDESGALNEAYADLFGNLIMPDAPATPPTWLIGERSTPPGAVAPVGLPPGTIRDMRNPAVFGDPAHMNAYIARSSPPCGILPSSCDSGGVHSNSAIINLAHVLLTDGIPNATGGLLTPGIGRSKTEVLAFRTMTMKLTPWSTFGDCVRSTRDMCQTLVARGERSRDNFAPFVQADTDQVNLAFAQVGLSPDLSSTWTEPSLGFRGTDTFFAAGETTSNGCPITNVTAMLSTPSGDQTADLSPGTGAATSVNFVGAFGITVVGGAGTPPAPIGGTAKGFAVTWFNVFGTRPSYHTNIITAPPPAGAADCISPINTVPVERLSGSVVRSGFATLPASGTVILGNTVSTMAPPCILVSTEVELLNEAGDTIAGPANSVTHTVTHYVFFTPVNFNVTATILTAPPGPPDMSASVSWSADLGRTAIMRLRYRINAPAVGACNP